MGKPTYDELFKKYLRVEEDREELIFESDWLHDRINKAIEYIEDKMDLNKECPKDLLDILKGSDKE